MNTPSGWTECPAGAFTRLTANLALRRQREIWLTALAWAVGALMAVAGSWATAGAIEGWLTHDQGGCAHQAGSCGSPTTTPTPCSTPSSCASK
jgi:hypothetical protein